MGHTGEASAGSAQDRLRAVLAGLRSIANVEDPRWRPRLADARAIVEGAWAALADVLDDTPHAGAVLELLRRMTVADDVLMRAAAAPRQLGRALARLESAPASVPELVKLRPQLTRDLGFDRAIISRIVNGMWISEAVYVTDDPEWAAEINRVGQEAPQRLVPGLYETEIVRRREAMIVTDVQRDTNVHRRIADASRSQSYVGAPLMSGNKVVGLLHADCYLQGRDPDGADCDSFVAYAKGLQMALSRAHLAEQLDRAGSQLRQIANDCQNDSATVHEFSFGRTQSAVGQPAFPLATRATTRGIDSVRAALTAREVQILELVAEGLGNGDIAARLVISEGTVKQHVKHVLRKLGARNRVEAVSLLFQSDRA